MNKGRYWASEKKKPTPRNKMKVGEVYSKLTVIEYAGSTKSRIKTWLCSCDCGGSRIVRHDHLRSGKVVSCGCTNKRKFFTYSGQ